MKHHFILLTTTENVEVAVNVETIAAVYEHGEYRSLLIVGIPDDYMRVKESLGDILTLVHFPQ